MGLGHWRRPCPKGRQNSYSTVPKERSPWSHPHRSPRRNKMSSPSTRIRFLARHNEWHGAKVWSVFKTSTSTFKVTDPAAWYANKTMGEDWNRHIWVQLETPHYCRLFLQIFCCQEAPDMRVQSVCSNFTEVLTEFAMPTTIIAVFGTQYTSKEFKKKFQSMSINNKQAAIEEIIRRRSIKRNSIMDVPNNTNRWQLTISMCNRKQRWFISGCQRTS